MNETNISDGVKEKVEEIKQEDTKTDNKEENKIKDEKPKVKNKKQLDKDKLKKNLLYLSVKFLVIIIVLYLLLFKIFGLQVVNNNAMYPSIKEGALTIIYRLDKNYKTDDVVVADINGKEDVYRIIALEGDTVDITETGKLLINGFVEDREIFYDTYIDPESEVTFPYKVGKNEVFLMNDSRKVINDSRTFGSVNKKNIKGKVIAKLQIRDF